MSTHRHANWSCLPLDIHQYVFQHLYRQEDLRNCALVCKAWLSPAQTRLYTKVSRIDRIEQLEKFHRTVEQNPQLGTKVKFFSLKSFKDANGLLQLNDHALNERAVGLVTTLISNCLPNLVQFDCLFMRTYIPILDALTNSRLNSLSNLEFPLPRANGYEVYLYNSCAKLMADRLEELLITDNYKPIDQIDKKTYIKRFCSQLDRFKKLVDIRVHTATEEPIQLLEDIIENCSSLKRISFYRVHHDGNNLVTREQSAISRYIPRNNIEKFTTNTNIIDDQEFLSYITHKFPCLQNLELTSRLYNNPIDQNKLKQLMFYLIKFESFSVEGLNVDYDVITKTLGDFWSVTAKPGSVEVHFLYRQNEQDTSLYLEQRFTEVTYRNLDFRNGYYDFIENNGKFLGSLELSFLMFNQVSEGVLPKNFITYTLVHCPHIRSLSLSSWTIKEFTIGPIEKRTLDTLSFSGCNIHDGALESLSAAFTEINNLEIPHCNFNVCDEGRRVLSSPQKIMLPHTKINAVKVGYIKQIKCYSVRDKEYRYFSLANGKKHVVPSNEENYTRAINYPRIEIHSLTFPAAIKPLFLF